MTEDEIVEAMVAVNRRVRGYWEGTSSALERAAMKDALAVVRKFTPSPTPYVRPAAEIQAEIKRTKSRKLLSRFIDDDLRLAGRIEGLTFALTPPTQETETP